jgi:N-acetylglucosaminyldiphosphoundecaprenol N-acetyl-beta-D-mannosaminyltransferase
MHNRRIDILGVPLDNYQPEELISIAESGFARTQTQTIFSVNPEKIMRARKDPELLSALREADYLIPDGIGAVLGARILSKKKTNRVTGIALMDLWLQTAQRKRYRIFIFGASPAVSSGAAIEIMKKYPSLELVGYSHGYIEEGSYSRMIGQINDLETDILFVGLGSPKQEKWIHFHKKSLKVKICMGVGGSLDVIAGRVKRAPRFFQRTGLEWLYRLLQEPGKYRRQHFLPQFVFELLKRKLDST